MNPRRAVGISVLLFLTSLVINAVAARIIGVDLEQARPAELPASMWLVGIVSAAVLSVAGASWYFLPSTLTANTRHGMSLGVTVVLIGFLLDCVAIIPLDAGPQIMLGYVKSVPYWVAVALVFLGCTSVGAWSGRRESQP